MTTLVQRKQSGDRDDAVIRIPPTIPVDSGSERFARTLDLSDYLLRLLKYRLYLASFVFGITILVIVISLTRTKLYSATAIMQVDPSTDQVFDTTGHQQSAMVSTDALVTTAQQLLTNPAVVNRVVQKLDLANNPLFFSSSKNNEAAPRVLTPIQQEALEQRVTKMLSVSRPAGTLLLDIEARTPDPELSAQIANEVTQQFLDREYESKSKSTGASSAYMTAQLDDLRAAMERSQAALVNYEISHNVLNPDDKSNIMMARLSQLNQALSEAQSARMRLEADYDVAKSANLEGLAVSPLGQEISPYLQKLQKDRTVLAQMSSVYGPKNVLYQQQERNVTHDQSILNSQVVRLQNELQSQFRAAQQREALIATALAKQKEAVDAFNLRAIRYTALKGEADSEAKLYYDLLQRIKEADISANYHSNNIRVVSLAKAQHRPVYPRPFLMGALAFILTSILGLGAVAAITIMDSTAVSPEQVERWFNVPVLAILPESPAARRNTPVLSIHESESTKLPVPQNESASSERDPTGPFYEAVLMLHSTLMLSEQPASGAHILAVSSALPGEGKSTVISQLAAIRATLTQSRVVLVDADMRKPTVHRRFSLANRLGLSSVLQGKAELSDVIVPIAGSGSLHVIAAGPSVTNPSELLYLRMGDFLTKLQEQFDFILIDCPPMLGFADVSTIANLADDFLLVVYAGQTQRTTIDMALRSLGPTRATLRGIVLNRITTSMDLQYKYYDKAYGNYYRSGDHEGDDQDA